MNAHQSSHGLPLLSPTRQTRVEDYGVSPSSPTRQSKSVLQKEYREKEVDCFNTIRDIIKGLTGEELRTRHEILTKAIYILSSDLERQGGDVSALNAHEVHPGTNQVYEGTSYTVDHSIQLPLDWRLPADPDATIYHGGTLVYDQQCPDLESAPNQFGFPYGSVDWSNYPHFDGH